MSTNDSRRPPASPEDLDPAPDLGRSGGIHSSTTATTTSAASTGVDVAAGAPPPPSSLPPVLILEQPPDDLPPPSPEEHRAELVDDADPLPDFFDGPGGAALGGDGAPAPSPPRRGPGRPPKHTPSPAVAESAERVKNTRARPREPATKFSKRHAVQSVKITDEILERACDLVRLGVAPEVALGSCGVSRSVFSHWASLADKKPTSPAGILFGALGKAEDDYEVDLVLRAQSFAQRDPAMHRFLMITTRRHRFGPPQLPTGPGQLPPASSTPLIPQARIFLPPELPPPAAGSSSSSSATTSIRTPVRTQVVGAAAPSLDPDGLPLDDGLGDDDADAEGGPISASPGGRFDAEE